MIERGIWTIVGLLLVAIAFAVVWPRKSKTCKAMMIGLTLLGGTARAGDLSFDVFQPTEQVPVKADAEPQHFDLFKADNAEDPEVFNLFAVHVPKPEPKPEPKKPAVKDASYPIENSTIWQRGGVTMNKQQLVNHLAAENSHAGKFDRKWLESLTLRQLQSLHADDHEGSVHWDAIPGKQQAAKPAGHWERRKYCGANGCFYRMVWIEN